MPTNVLHKELSYTIVGALYEIYNTLGPGHKERIYQEALAYEFTNRGLRFSQEDYTPVCYKKTTVGIYYLDFIVEEDVIVELKQGNTVARQAYKQVEQYLKAKELQLGILALFGKELLIAKRILNIY